MTCHYATQKYPWHNQDGLVFEPKGPKRPSCQTTLSAKSLIKPQEASKRQSLIPDNIPNEILETIPTSFYGMFFLFFLFKRAYQDTKSIANHIITQKNDPLLITNYIPVTLANTIYKLYTSTPTSLLTKFGEKHKILHFIQERSIDHAILLTIMEDLGYPKILSNSSTTSTQTPHLLPWQPLHCNATNLNKQWNNPTRYTHPLPIYHFPRPTPPMATKRQHRISF